MKGTIKEVLQIIGGTCRITVEVPRVEDYEKLKKFETEKTECSIEIKKWFNRRSLDSNAYAWKLMSEMADKLSVNDIVMSKEAVYFKMLQDYGQSTFIKLMKEINPRDYGIKYFEVKQEDTKGTTYKVYKGSSEFDSKEMTIFIKGIVQECEQLGIETLTPRELEELNKMSYQKGE